MKLIAVLVATFAFHSHSFAGYSCYTTQGTLIYSNGKVKTSYSTKQAVERDYRLYCDDGLDLDRVDIGRGLLYVTCYNDSAPRSRRVLPITCNK